MRYTLKQKNDHKNQTKSFQKFESCTHEIPLVEPKTAASVSAAVDPALWPGCLGCAMEEPLGSGLLGEACGCGGECTVTVWYADGGLLIQLRGPAVLLTCEC